MNKNLILFDDKFQKIFLNICNKIKNTRINNLFFFHLLKVNHLCKNDLLY